MAALAMLLCAAAEPPAPAATSSNRELVVAIKEAPPFVIKGGDGSWQGISIDLWRHLSEQLHLQ